MAVWDFWRAEEPSSSPRRRETVKIAPQQPPRRRFLLVERKRYKSVELFAGAGGLALGLEEAGFDHVRLFEWDADSVATVAANSRPDGPAEGWVAERADVRTVGFARYAGQVSLVSGGPPCQPFSLGGKAKAHEDKRDMFPEAVRAVREARPEAFVFENVKGLLRKSFEPYFRYILLQLAHPSDPRPEGMSWEEHLALLEKLGNPEYEVCHKLLNAADYGVPQQRHRVFIVGFASGLGADFSFPAPTHSKEALLVSKWVTGDYWKRHSISPTEEKPSDLVIRKALEAVESGKAAPLPWVTVRDAISDLPAPGEGTVPNHEPRLGARSYPGHSGSRLDEPAKTIKAGAHGVPGGENMIVLDTSDLRYLTVRESARIQTFPDDYVFPSSWTESMRQIGNAVPVRLAKAVGMEVAKHLGGK